MCTIGYHPHEDLYRRQTDQRYLVWLCKHCNKVTRQLKMTREQMKLFKAVRTADIKHVYKTL